MKWDELQQASLEDILAWADPQPWCRAMAECRQDSEWHAEGDVWTHTKMVCRQLTELPEWPTISKLERTTLLLTAMFHDAAKPLTSQIDPDTGRVTSPKHAVKGEHIARDILRRTGCDLSTREEIARLVRNHGRPVFMLDREQPAHEVIRLSWLVSNRLLYLFALADNRGRVTDSITRPEENLQYWKLQAEELRCYDNPFPFANDHCRFTFFRQRAPDVYYTPHEKFSCQVTMISGVPGSGKDTWLARHRPEIPIVSLDGIRRELGIGPTENQGAVVQMARDQCRGHLRAGNPFAFNATNILRQTRARWIDLFADYDARIELVYVESPPGATLQPKQEPLSLRPRKGRPQAAGQMRATHSGRRACSYFERWWRLVSR
jgi:predicted kinase